MLGIPETHIDVATLPPNDSQLKSPKRKYEANPLMLEKYRRSVAPIFTGGLALERISELNAMVDRELQLIKRGFLREEFTLDLKLTKALASYSKQVVGIKTREAVLQELYHSLGKNSLAKMADYVRQRDLIMDPAALEDSADIASSEDRQPKSKH